MCVSLYAMRDRSRDFSPDVRRLDRQGAHDELSPLPVVSGFSRTHSDRPTTYVLGLGNVLMSDDGFGPSVISALDQQFVVGPDVAVIDLGTPGLDMTPWFADIDRIIIVDTIKSDDPPGTLHIYGKVDLLAHAPPPRVSPHAPGVKETLLMLELAGRAPRDVTLVGVVPGRTTLGLELTRPVREAVTRAVLTITSILRGHGIPVTRKAQPPSPPATSVPGLAPNVRCAGFPAPEHDGTENPH